MTQATALPRTPPLDAPSYATYPAVDRLDEAFGSGGLARALAARRALSDAGICVPMALEVRVPTMPAAGRGDTAEALAQGADYADALGLEIALVTDQVGACRTLSSLRLSGAPAALPDGALHRLMGAIRRSFFLTPDADVAIDVSPGAVDASRLRLLHRLGFDRLDIAVLDLDAQVLRELGRSSTFEQVQETIHWARSAGFAAIHAHLVHGLANQTPRGFRRALEQAAALRPDGIRIRRAAPRPGRPAGTATRASPGQAALVQRELLAVLDAQGYAAIGPDRFALPGHAADGRADGLFADRDQLGLGVAATGRIGACAYQNEGTLDAWLQALDEGRLPVARGLDLDADDRVRRDIIASLVRGGRVAFVDIMARHQVDLRTVYADDIARLAPLVAEGLVELRDDGIRLTAEGQPAARIVASTFDRHLRDDARIAAQRSTKARSTT